MIYYFSDIVTNRNIIKQRNYKGSEAGKLRTLFIANAIKEQVKIVSVGRTDKKGIFPPFKESLAKNITIQYLRGFQLNVVLNLIFYFFYIGIFLMKNIRKDDTIVLYNLYPNQTIPVTFFKKILRYQLVVEIEELYSKKDNDFLRSALYRFSEKVGYSSADKFIVVNSHMKKYLPSKKPTLVSMGYPVDLAKNTFDLDEQVPAVPSIVYTGRLDDEGGIEVLLESLHNIKNNCEVVLTGSGALKEKVSSFKTDNPNIKFIYKGFVDNDDYEKILSNAHVCVNPIRVKNAFSNVSFPSKVLNYLNYGNLVVSSSFAGISDLSKSLQDNIILYSNDDPNLLAKALDEAMEKKIDKSLIKSETKEFFYQQSEKISAFIQTKKE